MQSEWLKILVFSMLSLVLGFILGRVTLPALNEVPRIEKRVMMTPEPGNMQKRIETAQQKELDGSDFMIEDADIQAVIEELESSDFEGDSTFSIGGAQISVTKEGGRLEVEVRVEQTETLNY